MYFFTEKLERRFKITLSQLPSPSDQPATSRPPEPRKSEIIAPRELEEEIILAPVVSRSPPFFAESLQSAELDDEPIDDLPEPALQFSLRDMMLITFMAAAGFAVMRRSPPAAFAGTMGGLAILGMIILTIVKPQRAIFHLLWWTVLGIYIVSSIIAFLTK